MFPHSLSSLISKREEPSIFSGKYRKYKHSKAETLSGLKRKMVSLAVTAWMKDDHWAEIQTFKFNTRAREFYYCCSKVEAARE